jgi:hypothetical protein
MCVSFSFMLCVFQNYHCFILKKCKCKARKKQLDWLLLQLNHAYKKRVFAAGQSLQCQYLWS